MHPHVYTGSGIFTTFSQIFTTFSLFLRFLEHNQQVYIPTICVQQNYVHIEVTFVGFQGMQFESCLNQHLKRLNASNRIVGILRIWRYKQQKGVYAGLNIGLNSHKLLWGTREVFVQLSTRYSPWLRAWVVSVTGYA